MRLRRGHLCLLFQSCLFFLSLDWHVFDGFLRLTQAFLHIMSLGFCLIRVFRAEIEKHPVRTGWTSKSVVGSHVGIPEAGWLASRGSSQERSTVGSSLMGSDFRSPKRSELEARGAAHRIQGRPESREPGGPGMRVPRSDGWCVTHEHRGERPSSGLCIPVQRPKVTFLMKDSLWLHVHRLSERASHRKSPGCM